MVSEVEPLSRWAPLMELKKRNFALIQIVLMIIIASFYINSTTYFRLKLVDFYKRNNHPEKAIQTYNKILRKDNLNHSLQKDAVAKIYFDLGYLYAKLNFTNLAIESYAKGIVKSLDFKTEEYLFKNSVEIDKLVAIGFLEAGKWDKAIEIFGKLLPFYYSVDMQRYINSIIFLKKENLNLDDRNFFFLIGDTYIQNQLFDEAREFFTKRILDYGLDIFEVLAYLQKKYSNDSEVKKKVWGNEIYVVLEDFETTEIQIANWVCTIGARIDSHSIDKDIAYKGHRSEWFDIAYFRRPKLEGGDFDYWFKSVKLPLNNENLKLGIRLFIKNINSSSHLLGFNVIYQKQATSGVYSCLLKQDVGGGWQEYKIEDLYCVAKSLADPRKWSMEGMFIDKILIDTKGFSEKFFVDEIELYLLNK